ncbi:hypothetical protein ACPXCG_22740 [Gordonia sp. DT218]
MPRTIAFDGMVVVTQGVILTLIYFFAPRNGLLTRWIDSRRTSMSAA